MSFIVSYTKIIQYILLEIDYQTRSMIVKIIIQPVYLCSRYTGRLFLKQVFTI